MTARFRQDLNASLGRLTDNLGDSLILLRQAHLITSQTLRRWAQLARDGFRDFVEARGIEKFYYLALVFPL